MVSKYLIRILHFHTIKSILNKNIIEIEQNAKENFHTIKSILN